MSRLHQPVHGKPVSDSVGPGNTKSEIKAYLDQHGIEYGEDDTKDELLARLED